MENKNFIVETHSDYMIDRFRLRTRRSFDEGKILSDQFQVVYFEKKKLGNELHIIEINPDGTYSENQPKGFRDFFIKEQLNLLEL